MKRDQTPFEVWYAENKHSECLKNNYAAYRLEAKQMGDKPVSFKKWARGAYQED